MACPHVNPPDFQRFTQHYQDFSLSHLHINNQQRFSFAFRPCSMLISSIGRLPSGGAVVSNSNLLHSFHFVVSNRRECNFIALNSSMRFYIAEQREITPIPRPNYRYILQEITLTRNYHQISSLYLYFRQSYGCRRQTDIHLLS
jgi:hypothetical protein